MNLQLEPPGRLNCSSHWILSSEMGVGTCWDMLGYVDLNLCRPGSAPPILHPDGACSRAADSLVPFCQQAPRRLPLSHRSDVRGRVALLWQGSIPSPPVASQCFAPGSKDCSLPGTLGIAEQTPLRTPRRGEAAGCSASLVTSLETVETVVLILDD